MSAQPGNDHNRPPVPESDTVIRSSGTVILGSGAIVRSSRTVIRLNEEKKLDHSIVTVISHVTWVGVGVNIVLAVLKLIGGIFGRSQALIADAAHTISDLATDAAVLIGVRYWSEPADAVHPHGHGKIETLVTLIIGIMLAIVGLALGYEAILTLSQGQPSGGGARGRRQLDRPLARLCGGDTFHYSQGASLPLDSSVGNKTQVVGSCRQCLAPPHRRAQFDTPCPGDRRQLPRGKAGP